jgi:hypothetical protein
MRELCAATHAGALPLPKGEGWGEGLQTIDKSDPPHPTPLPDGEREQVEFAAPFAVHLLAGSLHG